MAIAETLESVDWSKKYIGYLLVGCVSAMRENFFSASLSRAPAFERLFSVKSFRDRAEVEQFRDFDFSQRSNIDAKHVERLWMCC